jgi:DNA-binding MarR family transcriptional regulator
VRVSSERQQPPREVSATAAVLGVLRTGSHLLDELAPVFAQHGVSAARFGLLDALAKSGGSARPAELRALLHLPAQTLTGVIDQLQTAGLVSRSPHPTDRRSVLVEITAEGRAAIDRIRPPLIEIEQDCLASLSAADRRRLAVLLDKIEARIATRRARQP